MAVDIIARGMAANAASKGGDYENLTNLPQINGHELKGNLSSDSLGLQEAIQFEEMPEASADYLGKVYQYIGETETYKQGSFYICTTDGEEPPSFQWVELSSLDDYYTKEEAEEKIDEKINSIPITDLLHYQGHLDSIEELPLKGQESGIVIENQKSFSKSMKPLFNKEFDEYYKQTIEFLSEKALSFGYEYFFNFGNRKQNDEFSKGDRISTICSNSKDAIKGIYFNPYTRPYPNGDRYIHAFVYVEATEENPAYFSDSSGYTTIVATYENGEYDSNKGKLTVTKNAWVYIGYFPIVVCDYDFDTYYFFAGNLPKPLKFIKPYDTLYGFNGSSDTDKIDTLVKETKTLTIPELDYNYNYDMNIIKFDKDNVGSFVTNISDAKENAMYTIGNDYNIYVCDEDLNWNEWSKTDLSNYYTKEEVDTITNRIEAIAKGRATGYVFNTKADMDLWLEDEKHVAKLNMGDNLYIIDRDTPDYWWDGTQPQELETQKVDLSEYYKKSETDAKIDEKIASLDVYTKAQTDAKIDEKIAAIPTNTLLHYKGHVNSVDDLPSTGQESGVVIGTPVNINGTVKNKLALSSTPTSFVTTLNNKANELGMPYYIGYTGKGACNFGIFFKDVDSITGISCANLYELGIGSRYPMFIKVKASTDNPIKIVSYGNEAAVYIACMDISDNSKLYRGYAYNGRGYTLTKDAIISFETTLSSSRASGSLVSNTGATFKYTAITTYWDAGDNILKDFGDNNKSAYHAYDTTKVYYTNDGMKFLSFNLDTYTATIVQNDPSPLAKENAMYTVGDSYDIYVCDNRPHWNLWSEAKVKIDEDTINMNSDSELQSIGNILQNGGFQHYWKGTKVEYAAIEEKDPNTLYEILDDEETALFEVDGNTIEFSPDGLLRVPNNMDMMFQSVTYGNHESGYRKWRNGFIEQWGVTTSSADGEVEFTMHQPHIDQNFSVFVEPREMGNFFHYAIPSANQKFKCRIQTRDSQNMAVRFQWHSYGYFK